MPRIQIVLPKHMTVGLRDRKGFCVRKGHGKLNCGGRITKSTHALDSSCRKRDAELVVSLPFLDSGGVNVRGIRQNSVLTIQEKGIG